MRSIAYLTIVKAGFHLSKFGCTGRAALSTKSNDLEIELNIQNKYSGALFKNTIINMDLSRREIIIVLLLIRRLNKKNNDCKDKKHRRFWVRQQVYMDRGEKENFIYSSTG